MTDADIRSQGDIDLEVHAWGCRTMIDLGVDDPMVLLAYKDRLARIEAEIDWRILSLEQERTELLQDRPDLAPKEKR